MKLKKSLLAVFLFGILLVGALAAYRVISGESLGIKKYLRQKLDMALVLVNHSRLAAGSDRSFTNVVFLHHSVGRNLLDEGGVRELLNIHQVQLWDQDYSWRGLRDPQGRETGFSYAIPADNTDPDGLVTIFNQEMHTEPVNAISQLFQHETIILKSCFPTSDIPNDVVLEKRKSEYLAIRKKMLKHPEHLFILVTQPPLTPELTTPQAAARARLLAEWLKSSEYLEGAANVRVFDLFEHLATAADDLAAPNTLRPAYQNGQDAHPNVQANQIVGPEFARFILQAIEEYRGNESNRPIANRN